MSAPLTVPAQSTPAAPSLYAIGLSQGTRQARPSSRVPTDPARSDTAANRRPRGHRAQSPDGPSGAGFLSAAKPTPRADRLFEEDNAGVGYVTNSSRLWARMPTALDALFDLQRQAVDAGRLTFRQRGILVTACASALGDSYCSLAWGGRLATDAGTDVAASVLRGDDEGLNTSERALARWARKIVITPNETSPADVADLRRAGFDDDQIFAITMFVALRLAFSTVNDALGIQPDKALAAALPRPIRDAVTFGRALRHRHAVAACRPVDPSRPGSALIRRSATFIRVQARDWPQPVVHRPPPYRRRIKRENGRSIWRPGL